MKVFRLGITVLLFIVSATSCQKQKTVIYPTAAAADFSFVKSEYNVKEEIQLTDKSVADKGNHIVSWEWDFGTADIPKSMQQNPKVVYTAENIYTVKLTVTDNNGLTSLVSKPIKIIDPANNVRVAWNSALAEAIQNTVSPALSPDEKTVYMIADRADANGDLKLFAYNTDNGSKKWEFNLDQALSAVNVGGNPRQVFCSPSVGADGTVYIAIRDLQSTGVNRRSFLFAINSSGTAKWNYAFGYDVNFNYITIAVGQDGNVYVGGLTNAPFNVVVLSQATGAEIKRITLPVGVRSGLALSKSGDVYLASTGANGVFGYNIASASQKFNYKPTGLSTTGGDFSIGTDGTIYTTATIGTNGAVLAINSDGAEKWVYKTSGGIDFGGVVIGTDGTLYAPGGRTTGTPAKSDGLIALNPDGTLKWKFEITEAVTNCVPLVDNRGYIHFVTDLGTYYVVKPDGTMYGSISLGVKSLSSPVMDATGKVYIGAEKTAGVSELISITSRATGPANSSWPMKGQDSRRTHAQK
jgi:outer membrane protein assembly factor BamB